MKFDCVEFIRCVCCSPGNPFKLLHAEIKVVRCHFIDRGLWALPETHLMNPGPSLSALDG